MHPNTLSITHIYIMLLFNFNVRTHKLEIDAPVHVASEGNFQGTREEKVYNGTMDH